MSSIDIHFGPSCFFEDVMSLELIVWKSTAGATLPRWMETPCPSNLLSGASLLLEHL